MGQADTVERLFLQASPGLEGVLERSRPVRWAARDGSPEAWSSRARRACMPRRTSCCGSRSGCSCGWSRRGRAAGARRSRCWVGAGAHPGAARCGRPDRRGDARRTVKRTGPRCGGAARSARWCSSRRCGCRVRRAPPRASRRRWPSLWQRPGLGGDGSASVRSARSGWCSGRSEGRVQLSADTSGALLHRRGWRQEVSRAPMRETLAAGVLALAGHVADACRCGIRCAARAR